MNVILITSVVYTNSTSIFDPPTRLEQLCDTIDNVYQYIPNPYIIVIEGSPLNTEDITKIQNKNIHEFYNHVYTHDTHKSLGEVKLLLHYLTSQQFQRLRISHHILTINKLSGRYYFSPNFQFDYNSICKIRTENTWSGHGITETRYYRFPFHYIDDFITKLQHIHDNEIFIDLEHTFYKLNIIPNSTSSEINVKGIEAPTGKEIYD